MNGAHTRRWTGKSLQAEGSYFITMTRDEADRLARELPPRFEVPRDEAGADEHGRTP